MNPMASTPQPPYYAVLFTSVRTGVEDDEYNRTAERMIELAAAQPRVSWHRACESTKWIGDHNLVLGQCR